MIDAGDAMDREAIGREVSKIVALDKIKAVLFTHLHYDHIGSADLFSNAKFFASEKEVEDFKKNSRGFYFFVDEETDLILKEKLEIFDNEIFGMKVIEVPGHTRGSVAFLDEKRKLVFSGDTIFGGHVFGRYDLPNSVPEKMGDSVKMLNEIVSKKGFILCPGHGYFEEGH